MGFRFIKICLIVFAATAGLNAASAQNPMSLEECVSYGMEHNLGLATANLEIDKGNQAVRETYSNYLPQANVMGSLSNNLKLATQILPGEIIGQPGTEVPVQFGTKYAYSATFDVSQTIYNQAIIKAIKTAKEGRRLNLLGKEKAESDLMFNIASSYYAVQLTTVQKDVVEANLERLSQLLKITKVQLDNGFAKQIDYDRLLVNQSNLQTELDNVNNSIEMQLRQMKFSMGMPAEEPIAVAKLDLKQSDMDDSFVIDNHIDLRMIDVRRDLSFRQLEQIRAGYMPSLSLSFRYGYQAMQNELNIFGNNTNWFPNSSLGLSLNIPVFDGFKKNAQAKQIEIGLKQMANDRAQLGQSLQLMEANANSQLETNISIAENQNRNVKLAEEVLKTSEAQFTNGYADLSALLNAENALKEAQTNYLSALLRVKLAELELLNATGSIQSLINE